jgi:AcrR family transcriptional regulator
VPHRSPAADRRPLDRGRVIAAAVLLADAEGLDGLSMRRLGEALGVEAMSLYNHVTNKDDLLGAMADAVAAEIDPEAHTANRDNGDWRTAARTRCSAAHAALLRHPWAPALWAARTDIGPARMRLMDDLLGDLERAGFAPGTLDLAFHALQNHVLGHALQAASFPHPEQDLAELGRAYLRTFPVDDFPRLAAHIRFHIEDEPVTGERPSFDLALDLLLDGLARMLPPD